MSRTVRLTLEFDGTAYIGWQRQGPGVGLSVQQAVEKALEQILREKVTLHSSGRTDAGVHARAMVAHFRTEKTIPLSAFREGVNRFLPLDIAVRAAEEADFRFHARFDAKGKWYRYTIQNGPIRAPLLTRYAWNVREPLDLSAMTSAAHAFQGRHCFSAFRTSNCDAQTTHREIYSVDLTRQEELIHIDVRGSGFLRHMVRIMAGTLVEVGLHKRPLEDVARLLTGGSGLRSGITAPAQGLCLMEVYY